MSQVCAKDGCEIAVSAVSANPEDANVKSLFLRGFLIKTSSAPHDYRTIVFAKAAKKLDYVLVYAKNSDIKQES